MRCTLSLILVVAFTSLANAQQVFPKRLPKLDDLSGSQQQFTPRAPAAHGYFGPLDAVGTEQIPKAIPRSQSDDLSPIAEVDDSSMVDAVQFSENADSTCANHPLSHWSQRL